MDPGSISTNSFDGYKKEAANLSHIEEFGLLTALWRALDSQAPNPILGDPYAQETFDRCRVDQEQTLFSSAEDQRWVRFTCNRSKTVDKWCQQFLDLHSNEKVQVLHLCCGLDARSLRMQWGENVRWVDIDLPSVVNLRKRLAESFHHDRWLVQRYKAEKLFRGVVDYFGTGQFAFDTLGTLVRKYEPDILRKSPLEIRWVIDDMHAVEKFHPKLRMRSRVRWQEYLGNELPMGQNLPPFFGRWTTALMSVRSHTAFKSCLQVALFDFGDRALSVNSSVSAASSQQEEVESSLETSSSHRSEHDGRTDPE
ncbi:hypothetical protein M406DRAFT_68119 [Cryphonectria parasitica EP155]|uniref:S-adenosyl-L-methionine-dependent methyltransferase n=1 Tax=Cryphonectria parasitica (strain ATCC 38755 / EP155) TaxID=660469 RepID=A0A9P4Y377_CRYP1|nr:uncharacterized protein M406DRAFT_68119 [Cryphonectria parasitica EP155]KAF3765698.1 hypothetical protein M406DRAFT_68119 [Cryphonectria parasitica EP155]